MSEKKLVWDLPLRLFHWLFGSCLIAAWIAIEFHAEELHMYLGYSVIYLLIFRIVWGVFGTRHSQFKSFFPSPRKAFAYLKSTFRGEAKETVGHNPLGSLMVFAMYALVAIQVASGVFVEGEIWFGPYNGAVSSASAKLLEKVHNINFSILRVLVIIHIVVVFLYLLLKKTNLIVPMISGKKDADLVPEKEAISHSKLVLAAVIALLVAAFVYWLIFVAPPPVYYDDYGY